MYNFKQIKIFIVNSFLHKKKFNIYFYYIIMYFFSILKIILINTFYYLIRTINYNEFAINILKKIGDLNIIFAKIFQWSFLNKNKKNNYITDEIHIFLRNYTNNAPYKKSDINFDKLLQIYLESKKNGDIFELDSLVPINSGTISLIFKGKLNNKQVVIKLLRNDIENELVKGLEFLTKTGNTLKIIPYVKNFMFDKIIDRNKENFYEQKNFINEVSNLKMFYSKLKKKKFCICPNVYPLYTEKINDVIIMDYLDGKKIDELNEEEKDKFIIPAIKFLKNSIFIKNILHCDLHTGNIIFITENVNNNIRYKVGIIDTGMILNLSITESNLCYLFFNTIFDGKFEDLVEFITNVDVIKTLFIKIDESKIDELKNCLIDKHNNENLFKNNSIENVIDDTYIFLNMIEKYNFEFSKNTYKIILSLLPIFSLVVGLGNNSKNCNLVINELLQLKKNDIFDDL